MLMQLERGAVLQTHHQMGLRRTKSPSLHARVYPQSPHPLPTPPPPAKQQDQPYPHVKPNYGAKMQYAQEDDNSPALNKAGKKSSKRFAEYSCFWQGQSMVDSSRPSALLWPNRQTQQRHQWFCARNFWTSCQHRKKPYSPTKQATWSLKSTATRSTSMEPNPAAAPEAICSWREKTKSNGQSSTSTK